MSSIHKRLRRKRAQGEETSRLPLLALAAALCLVLSSVVFAACGSDSDSSSSSASETATSEPEAGGGDSEELVAEPIGTSTKDPSEMKFRFMTQIDGVPYYQTVEAGAKAAAADLGIGDIEVTGPPRVDSSLQIGTVQTWITEGVDVIAVSSTDPEAMTPVINEAIAAGITVVSWDVDAPESERPIYVNGWSEEEGPQVLFEKFAEDLNGVEEGQYAVLLPSLTSSTHNGWADTAKEFQEENYPGMEEVERIGVEADQTIAAEKVKQLKSKYPDLIGILSVDAGGTVGAAQATEELNLVGKFANTGLSTPSQMKPFLDDGTTKHTVLWDPAITGYLTTVIGLKLAQGEAIKDGEMLAVNSGEEREIPLARWKGALQAVQGPPLVFTKQNVSDFDF